MPNSATRTTHEQPWWKSSLLNKEEDQANQNPMNYFDVLREDNDCFSDIWEYIERQSEAKQAPLFRVDGLNKPPSPVTAFIIAQDRRGVHLVCPLELAGDRYKQQLYPLHLTYEHAEDAFIDKVEAPIGSINISADDFLSTCSRGFENASAVLLGEKAITMAPDYRVVAVFIINPQA